MLPGRVGMERRWNGPPGSIHRTLKRDARVEEMGSVLKEGMTNWCSLSKTREGLSSLSDQNLHCGRTCIAGGGCDKTPCIHYLSDRHNTSHYSFCSISPDSESRFPA